MNDPQELPFWERPDTVDRFSGRAPDLRLVELVKEYGDAARVRVLDLGCAGGRNAVFLAEHGFDLVAVDASPPMIEETRRRVGEVLGEEEAAKRVRRGRMDRIEGVEDDSVDLVVALGVLHSAASRAEWDAALREVYRVLRPGGRVLVANHTDEFDPDGKGLLKVPGEDPLYERSSGRSFLVDADTLDREMAAHGFEVLTPTETVRRANDRGGTRVTANGFYGKGGS